MLDKFTALSITFARVDQCKPASAAVLQSFRLDESLAQSIVMTRKDCAPKTQDTAWLYEEGILMREVQASCPLLNAQPPVFRFGARLCMPRDVIVCRGDIDVAGRTRRHLFARHHRLGAPFNVRPNQTNLDYATAFGSE